MWLWRMENLKRAGWSGKLEIQKFPWCKVQRASAEEFPHSWRGWSFCSSRAFNWLDEAHPCYEGQSAILQVHQCTCQSQPNTPFKLTQNQPSHYLKQNLLGRCMLAHPTNVGYGHTICRGQLGCVEEHCDIFPLLAYRFNAIRINTQHAIGRGWWADFKIYMQSQRTQNILESLGKKPHKISGLTLTDFQN